MIEEHYVLRSKSAPQYKQPVGGGYRTDCFITLENGRRKRPIRVAVIDSWSGFVLKFYKDGRRVNEQPLNNFLPIKATEHSNVSYRFTVSIVILEHAYGHEYARTLFDREEIMPMFTKLNETDRFTLAIPLSQLFEAVVSAKQRITLIRDLEPEIHRKLMEDSIKRTDELFYKDILGL